MKYLLWSLALLLPFSWTAPAQTGVHLTVNYPPASVVSAMFGALPKDVTLAEVTACNETPSTLALAGGRVVQALRANGIQALSRDAAISAMQSSEQRTWKSILLRNATHGMNIVNFLVISRALTLGPALGSTLPAVQALMQAVIPEFAKDVPDHQYLNFDRNILQEHAQLMPLDCVTGLLFTAKGGAKAGAEIDLPMPAAAAPAAPSAALPLRDKFE